VDARLPGVLHEYSVTWTSGLAASSNKAQLIRCAVVSYPAVKKKPMFIARVS